MGLEFDTEKILVDEESSNTDENNKNQKVVDDEDPLDLDEIMAGLQTPINMQTNDEVMNENYFSLRMKNHIKLYTFKNNNVQAIYNLIANYIGNK